MQTLDRQAVVPAWCVADYPDQVKSLQSELDTCRKQMEAASKRIEYIQKIFAYCSQASEWLNFADESVVSGAAKVLDVAGWKTSVDKTNPHLLQMTDDSATIVFALVSVGSSAPDRTQVAMLIKNQTDWWQETGVEPKALLIYDSEVGAVDPELQSVAAKKSIGLLSKRDLLKMAADVLINETDPDDLRVSMLSKIERN